MPLPEQDDDTEVGPDDLGVLVTDEERESKTAEHIWGDSELRSDFATVWQRRREAGQERLSTKSLNTGQSQRDVMVQASNLRHQHSPAVSSPLAEGYSQAKLEKHDEAKMHQLLANLRHGNHELHVLLKAKEEHNKLMTAAVRELTGRNLKADKKYKLLHGQLNDFRKSLGRDDWKPLAQIMQKDTKIGNLEESLEEKQKKIEELEATVLEMIEEKSKTGLKVYENGEGHNTVIEPETKPAFKPMVQPRIMPEPNTETRSVQQKQNADLSTAILPRQSAPADPNPSIVQRQKALEGPTALPSRRNNAIELEKNHKGFTIILRKTDAHQRRDSSVVTPAEPPSETPTIETATHHTETDVTKLASMLEDLKEQVRRQKLVIKRLNQQLDEKFEHINVLTIERNNLEIGIKDLKNKLDINVEDRRSREVHLGNLIRNKQQEVELLKHDARNAGRQDQEIRMLRRELKIKLNETAPKVSGVIGRDEALRLRNMIAGLEEDCNGKAQQLVINSKKAEEMLKQTKETYEDRLLNLRNMKEELTDKVAPLRHDLWAAQAKIEQLTEEIKAVNHKLKVEKHHIAGLERDLGIAIKSARHHAHAVRILTSRSGDLSQERKPHMLRAASKARIQSHQLPTIAPGCSQPVLTAKREAARSTVQIQAQWQETANIWMGKGWQFEWDGKSFPLLISSKSTVKC